MLQLYAILSNSSLWNCQVLRVYFSQVYTPSTPVNYGNMWHKLTHLYFQTHHFPIQVTFDTLIWVFNRPNNFINCIQYRNK